jgi:hypothetical protein
MARPVLRRFLYLDSSVVDELVSQIEGGLYGEEAQRIVTGSGRKRGGELGVGLGGASAKGSAGRESSTQDERARTMEQTPESRFARLYDSLASEGAIQWLEVLDEEIWNQLRRGEVIEVDGIVALSGLNKLLALADQFGPILGAMQTFDAEAAPDDAEAAKMMRELGAFATLFGTNMLLVVRTSGSPEVRRPDQPRPRPR